MSNIDQPSKDIKDLKSLLTEDPEKVAASPEFIDTLTAYYREQRSKFMQLETDKASGKKKKSARS